MIMTTIDDIVMKVQEIKNEEHQLLADVVKKHGDKDADGIYHYFFESDFPYIAGYFGDEFFGGAINPSDMVVKEVQVDADDCITLFGTDVEGVYEYEETDLDNVFAGHIAIIIDVINSGSKD